MTLQLLTETFAICRLEAESAVPAWATKGSFFSVTRTVNELSIVCEQSNLPADIKSEKGWRIFKIDGTLDSWISIKRNLL